MKRQCFNKDSWSSHISCPFRLVPNLAAYSGSSLHVYVYTPPGGSATRLSFMSNLPLRFNLHNENMYSMLLYSTCLSVAETPRLTRVPCM